MKIVYAATSPLAGVCELMARVVNQYFFPEHEACVLNVGPGRHMWYCREGVEFKRYNIEKRNEIEEALAWGEVIHCMANTSHRKMGRIDLLHKKVWVFQWHGAQIQPWHVLWREQDYKYVKWCHIGQGWQRDKFFKPFFENHGCVIMPNIITADDPLHIPTKWEDRHKRIGFSPSNSKKGVNRKGVEETNAVFGGPRFDLISALPFERCLHRKRTCVLGIDELVTPLYHRSGLEFLSQGTACFCSFDRYTERTLKDATGSNKMPFMKADLSDVKSKASKLLRDMEKLRKLGVQARDWIENYYHPKTLMTRYLEYYKK